MAQYKVIIFVIITFLVIALISSENNESYTPSNPIIDEIKRRFEVISPRFKNIPIKEGDRSFTEDKTEITLCLKHPHTKEYYDMNTLTYVGLHELSHILTKAHGKDSHAAEFKNNFTNLLNIAAERGVYDPSLSIPESYCNIKH